MIILITLLFGLALGAAGFVVYKRYFAPADNAGTTIRKNTPTPKLTANGLNGLEVPADVANRSPLAVLIENQPPARPQIGLDKASIIYEAITEGGITRFMAIYGPNAPKKIGPVRSVRTYFLDWAAEYNAFLAHVGGNIDALDRIGPEKFLDLDEFALGEKAYWREPERGKAIEHTMFADAEKLYAAAQAKGWEMKGDFTTLKFLKPAALKTNPGLTQEIEIDFSSGQFMVKYVWSNQNNNYPREMAGSAHKDRDTGNDLAPTSIIIQSVERTEGLSRINETSWTMKTIGEGKAYVIFGGQKIDATWKKNDLKSRTLFYDSGGNEIEFPPGQIWYEIVPPDVFDKINIS